jgi:hypothetical protein
MEVHFLLLILALILFLFSVDKNHIKVGIFLSALLFFGIAFVLETFRAPSVGNDTHVYVNYFESMATENSFADAYSNGRFEPGFVFINYVVSQLTDNYMVLFFIFSLINFGAALYFFRKYCHSNYSWALLWLIWGVLYFQFSGIRASLAVSFSLLFFDAILQHELKRSIFFYLLAISFHYSAIVCGVAFFLRVPFFQRLMKSKILLLCAFIVVGVFLDYFMSFLPDYYLSYYTDSEYAEGSVRLASIVNFAFLSLGFLLCYTTKNISSLWKYYDNFMVFYILGLGFSFLGLIFNPFNRVEMFFIPLTIVYVIKIFTYLPPLKKYGLEVLYTLLTIYQVVTFIVRPEWLNLFPYTFG